MFAAVTLGSFLWPSGPPLWIAIPTVVILFFMLIIVAMVLFNPKGAWHRKRVDPSLLARQLDAAGLLERQVFRAKRSFQIEEFEDEGSSYFLEIEDGRVLFLTGQYLYDYEASNEKPRAFPNTTFEIQRDRQSGYVVNIVCAGTALEPEGLASPFDIEELESQRIPKDGQLFSDRSYDELKIAWIDARKK